MGQEIIITVKNIYKSFRIPHERTRSLKGAFLNILKKKTFTQYDAAKDISFEVKKGEFLGIIGRNGCGKSTMLKMLAGIYIQNAGTINIDGALSPFLELGVGFNPELTARDNIYLNGTILGLSRREIDNIFDKVLDFAELEEFVDMKLKNFSSGMQVRLAFSVAINAHADILLIDEVLAVGDINFQKKCFDVFREFKKMGKTIIFVTHDMSSVRSFCDRVLVLDKGKKIFDGEVEEAIDIYTKLNFSEKDKVKPGESEYAETLGNHEAIISDYKILDKKGKESSILETGEEFAASINVLFKKNILNPSFGMMIRRIPTEDLLGVHTYNREEVIQVGNVCEGETITATFMGKIPLEPGQYYLTFKVSEELKDGKHQVLQMLNNFVTIEVQNKRGYWGIIDNDIDVMISRKNKSSNDR